MDKKRIVRIVIFLVFSFIFLIAGAIFAIPVIYFIMIGSWKNNEQPIIRRSSTTTAKNQVKGIELKCAKCNTVLKITDTVCTGCGEPFNGDNVVVSENAISTVDIPQTSFLLPSNFDPMYSLSEDELLDEFINKELVKAEIDQTTKLIPTDVLKRKKILNIIFSILVFIFVILIFFHFPLITYIIGLVILFIFFKVTRKYNLLKYLKKEIKARPGEKISNILMNVKNTFVSDNTSGSFILYLSIAIILPLIIFSTPKIIYEKVDGGYAVRYYIFGVSNFKSAVIPESYKGEDVISLRGNTFSNMPLLESVKLPDSIVEIRGQAFKNCIKLTEVNIPKNLYELGGGAFYNAKSLKTIELPDTLRYMGGEVFYGASSLETIKLSNKLKEIRGDSFKYCTSLKSIVIPDSVTRIGGHAFYGAKALSEVFISKNSNLTEIGSSAFRQCYSLSEITLPSTVYVNERAFKESPTSIKSYKENCYYMGNIYYCD